MTDAAGAEPANPDIFDERPVPARLTPYIRRIILADCHQDLDFTFNVHATGYCYLGWVWRGRWTGSVNGVHVFDTDRDGAIFCSGQVLDSHIESAISGVPGKLFVEFQPLGQYQLLGIAGDRTVEHAAAPDRLEPSLGPAFQPFRDAAPETGGDAATALMLGVLDRLAATARPLPRSLAEAVRRIEAADGAVQIGPLCDELGLSQRTFRRRFQRLTGLSPKRFCRVLQVTKAFNAMLEGQGLPLSEIALRAGFSDQAHFTRAFRAFLYRSPLRFSADVETTLHRFVGRARSRTGPAADDR